MNVKVTLLGCSALSMVGHEVIRAFGLLPAELLSLEFEQRRDMDEVLVGYKELVQPALGLIKGPDAHLHVNPRATPKFWKASHVVYERRTKVTEEMDRLVENRVLSPVFHCGWATPVIPVVKKNGSIRLCGDLKLTVNKACSTGQYHLPLIDDIFALLNGGDRFSTLDLREAYNQVPQVEESCRLTVLNTHTRLLLQMSTI